MRFSTTAFHVPSSYFTCALQARRVARLQELLAAEQREREREREREQQWEQGQHSSAGAPAAAASSSLAPDGAAGGSWGSWLRSAARRLGLSGHHQHGHQQQQHGSTPLQRERLAAVRREDRVAAELGPPPAAPQPPKGAYDTAWEKE